jgi:hypothetical protein
VSTSTQTADSTATEPVILGSHAAAELFLSFHPLDGAKTSVDSGSLGLTTVNIHPSNSMRAI